MEVHEWMATIWNANYPPGTEVRVFTDDRTVEKTKTRSVAWAIPSGEALVSLEGRAGGYSLKRVIPDDIE